MKSFQEIKEQTSVFECDQQDRKILVGILKAANEVTDCDLDGASPKVVSKIRALKKSLEFFEFKKQPTPVCLDPQQWDEITEAEHKLRQDIEEAIESAADSCHDSTLWWSQESQGPRLIETLITMIVFAARDYQKKVEERKPHG